MPPLPRSLDRTRGIFSVSLWSAHSASAAESSGPTACLRGSSVWRGGGAHGRGGGGGGHNSSGHLGPQLHRLLIEYSGGRIAIAPIPTALQQLAPHYLMALAARLPRGNSGHIDARGWTALCEELERAARGTPPALIDALPTRAWVTPPSSSLLTEAACQCGVCLGPYELGEVLRTLPCLHAFHKDCV